jgi:carbamoyltransferase
MLILGISCFYHDSAAVLLDGENIVGAAQEERFTRIKHDSSFPEESIKFVLSQQKINISDLDAIVFYEKPFLKFERILETYIAFAPKGFKSFCISLPIWLKEKLFQKKFLFNKLKKIDNSFTDESKIKFSEHHLSHAASSFYTSPYQQSLILTLDGVGEWATTTVGIGNGSKIEILKEIHFPHSIGLLYSAFTYYLGFRVNSGEYKVMGLAPYGTPIYKDIILKNVIDLKNDGSFKLNMKFFDFATGLKMTNQKFNNLFGRKRREPESENLEQFHMDIASSIQAVTEEVVLKIAKNVQEEYGIDNLCLSGGVALNCVVNGKILKNKIFKNVWIQPASGDAGGALGAALAYLYNEKKVNREINLNFMKGSYLGPSFDDEEIKNSLEKSNVVYQKLDPDNFYNVICDLLDQGMAVGWFQGKMEFGPRALGARSIIADPRSNSMQKKLNLKVKFRESFRPFAPAVLREDVSQYFQLDCDSPYMLLVANINDDIKMPTKEVDQVFGIEKLNQKRSTIPAVTHVDYSARVQTVHKETNEKFYKLLSSFKKKTNCSVLINTSFNVRGEPMVCTPKDAINCFLGTDLDVLVMENFIAYKKKQDSSILLDYKNKYKLD